MKKVLLILSVFFMGLVLVSCGGEDPVDGAVAKLDAAKTSLNAIISDPSNITENFEVPAVVGGGQVTVEWSSSEPGVLSFGEAEGGFVTATVNRPSLGDGDATVEITATLTIPSELEDTADLTGEWTLTVTVKENTVAEVEINNIADILAITDASYSGEYQVTISDVTVFAKGDDAAFAYDGTGTIEIYGGASSDMEVGKVYTVSGTISWYYGLWEITGSTASEQASATPQYPTKETIDGVSAYVAALLEAGEDAPAKGTVADGSFEPIYASVTGVVHLTDDSNYGTFVVDSNADLATVAVPGTAEAPADGFMVYYHTNDFPALKLYDGLEVTIDVVIYTYRSNNNAFAIYYVGGPNGIAANLSDAEKQSIDANSLSIPESTTEALTLELPATGANGSTIAWSFTDAENAANSYVDLSTGAVTVPSDEQVSVGITATVSFAGLDDVVVNFVIKVGEYPVSTVAEAIAMGEGATVKVVGIITDITDAAGYGAAYFQDATGGLNLFSGSTLDVTEDMIGKTYEIVGEVDLYNGLYELAFSGDDMVEITGEDALAMPDASDISALTLDAETLMDYQAELVDLTGFVLKYDLETSYTSSFNINMINAAGEEIAVRADKDMPGFAEFVALVAGKTAGTALDFTNGILGWYYSPQILVGSNTSVADGTAYTDAQKLQAALAVFEAPEADSEVTADLSLATTGLFGSTVVWTSSNEAVVSTAGVVTRPAVGEADATVTLGYTISLGAETANEVTVSVVVKAEEAPVDPQPSTPDLFISEYIEGTPGNRKAIEIYNPTDAAITLDGVYSIMRNSGDADVWDENSQVALVGTIQPGEVFVVFYDDSDNDSQFGSVGDQEGTLYFNGDDAVGLFKDGELLDIFGVFAEDPGAAWDLNGVTEATKDHVITRDPSVTAPSTTWVTSEWVVVGAYADGTTTTLGSHTVSAE